MKVRDSVDLTTLSMCLVLAMPLLNVSRVMVMKEEEYLSKGSVEIDPQDRDLKRRDIKSLEKNDRILLCRYAIYSLSTQQECYDFEI